MIVLVRTLLFFLLGVFLVRAVYRFLGGMVQGASSQPHQKRQASPPAVKMMRDPVCGTYVVPGKALELVRRGETLYFCSEKCRREYERR